MTTEDRKIIEQDLIKIMKTAEFKTRANAVTILESLNWLVFDINQKMTIIDNVMGSLK